MKEVFALDVDGVVLDIIGGSLDYVRDTYGVHLFENDVTDWDWDYIWSLPNGLDANFWTAVWNKPATPYPGAIDFIQDLKDLEFRVIAISTRPAQWKGIGSLARDAALRDFPQLPFDEVYLVDHHVDKVKIIRASGARYIVEDNPKNAMQCKLDGGARSFLLTRPWNKQCLTVNNAWERVDNYTEVLELVREG